MSDTEQQSTKVCSVCNFKKELSSFVKNNRRYDKLSTKCRQCIHNDYTQRAKYYANYYQLNKQKKIAYQREYYNTNKDKIKERRQDRKSIHNDFKRNIEAQWEPGMNWDNYRVYWDIQHQMPLTFNLDDTDQTLFSLSPINFKPVKLNINNTNNNKDEQQNANS